MPHTNAVKQSEDKELEPGMGVSAELDIDELEEDTESDEEMRMQLEESMQLFGAGLQTKFDRQVGLKEEIERRWLDDLRHYNGVYDQETERKLSQSEGKSRIFVNLTRSKCNTAESKWSDLVLPTDDRNWGIKPTPVPSLAAALTDETELKLANGETPVDPDSGEAYKAKDLAEETIKQAKKAGLLMQDEIDDQLTESKFNPTCRDVIHDSVVVGTGVIKGPMVELSAKKAWILGEGGQWEMSMQKEYKPTAANVDPWNFFPDMSATKWEDCEFVFERHLMVKKHLRALAKQPGFLSSQIAKVLQAEPNARSAKLNYINEIREINGISQTIHDNRYEVLEYHGPIEKTDLIAAGMPGLDIDDPLEEFEGVVWVCMGIVIKVGLNHMDSEELPYNVLNWEKDDTSVFGFGVPYRMRGPQKVMNSSWRMVLDNAGLSTGPQILINKKMVEPADGNWKLSPRKIWWMTSSDPKVRADYVMQTFNIESKQPELTNIFEMAHRLADEETSVPQMQMGNAPGDSQQPAMLKTLGGTALWMSANNIMMRKAVKNFDDDITVPFISRFYDWNMQFNKKPEIKGDFSVDARGTSVLLVREMQARNIQEFVGTAMNMPGGPEELKVRGVLKNMAKGMQVAIDDVLRTDDEKEAADEEAKTNPPTDPETQKLELQMNIKKMEVEFQREKINMENQGKMAVVEGQRQIALIGREIELTKIAAEGQLSMEQVRQSTGVAKYAVDWDIKKFYEELEVKKTMGETANYGLGEDS
jgi:hypothetical protein